MPTFALLDFGLSVDTRHIDAPIDAADFASFERRFRRLVERRREIHRAIPGGRTWPDVAPTREKLLEYYLTVDALALQSQTTYLDVASCVSLFPNYVAEVIGATVIRQDLHYAPGRRAVRFPRLLESAEQPTRSASRIARFFLRWTAGGSAPGSGTRIDCVGSDACAMPLPPQSVDAIGLHCSLEHFEGDADSRFAAEAFRILRPGGALLIIPFYCGVQHEEVVRPDFAVGCQFHRYYDPQSFAARVLARLPEPFRVEVRYYGNYREIDPSFYCCYSVCVRKTCPTEGGGTRIPSAGDPAVMNA